MYKITRDSLKFNCHMHENNAEHNTELFRMELFLTNDHGRCFLVLLTVYA